MSARQESVVRTEREKRAAPEKLLARLDALLAAEPDEEKVCIAAVATYQRGELVERG